MRDEAGGPKKNRPRDPEEVDRGKEAMNKEGVIRRRENEKYSIKKCWQRAVFKKGQGNYKNGLKGKRKAYLTTMLTNSVTPPPFFKKLRL